MDDSKAVFSLYVFKKKCYVIPCHPSLGIVESRVAVKHEAIVPKIFERESPRVDSNGLAPITLPHRVVRLILIEQKHNSSRTSSKRIEIVLDMVVPNVRDLASVDVDNARFTINACDFFVAEIYCAFESPCNSSLRRLPVFEEKYRDSNLLLFF